jgi:hypothetical protein
MWSSEWTVGTRQGGKRVKARPAPSAKPPCAAQVVDCCMRGVLRWGTPRAAQHAQHGGLEAWPGLAPGFTASFTASLAHEGPFPESTFTVTGER